MRIEKAIEQLEDALADKWCPATSELKASMRLGIAALKFTLAVRGTILAYATLPLPGETEE